MCDHNANLEEYMAHGLIGVMGVDHDQFNLWARDYFQVTDDSWDPWGADDPNDTHRPYGKTLNSIFLIGYALGDNHDMQWHSLEDYESLAAGRENRFHDHKYMRMIVEGGEAKASAEDNRIDLHCLLFNEGSIANSPSHRAGVLIHESWHHWQYKHDFHSGHTMGGAITWSQGDFFWSHGLGAFEFGHLHEFSYDPDRFHSPYQIEAEFFADLAECSRPVVPELICQTARDHGNILLMNAFYNVVPYRIGDPRPW